MNRENSVKVSITDVTPVKQMDKIVCSIIIVLL